MVKRVGLTLGKYAPFHKGHQYVVETALSENDAVIVIIYHSPETTNIPLPVRSDWIRTIYPQVNLIEAWDGPTHTGYTPEICNAHEKYIIEKLKIRNIDAFYSSEPYGDHMSKALKCRNRQVDPCRNRIPISGAMIRSDPYRYRQFVHPYVYKDLIPNIVPENLVKAESMRYDVIFLSDEERALK